MATLPPHDGDSSRSKPQGNPSRTAPTLHNPQLAAGYDDPQRAHSRTLFSVVTQMATELLKSISLEESMPHALRIISDVIQIDRVLVLEANHTLKNAPPTLRHSWSPMDQAAPNDYSRALFSSRKDRKPIILPGNRLPEQSGLREGRIISVTLHSGSPAMKTFLTKLQIKSILLIPIMIDGVYWGQVAFHDCNNERDWTDEEIDILRTLTNLIGASISHGLVIESLRTQEELLQAVVRSMKELLTNAMTGISISRALSFVGEALHLDRAIVIEYQQRPDVSPIQVVHHIWEAKRASKSGTDKLPADLTDVSRPSQFSALFQGDVVIANWTSSEPAMREFLDHYGIRSLLTVPITINEKTWGHVGFHDCHMERTWSNGEVDILRNLADLIGNVIARARYVTELSKARDEAVMKRAEAERANASKTAFLANMSHELRTPLNAILGFSEVIATEAFGPVGSLKYKEYAGDIHSSGVHLLSLINDLLDVAKIEAGKMEIEPNEIETSHIIECAIKLVATRLHKHHQKLTVNIDERVKTIYVGESALQQIIINLVSNASKFSPDGSVISINARYSKSGSFQLVVEDRGQGIPKEKIGQLFAPFSQLDNCYERQDGGTGLGLAMVRGLAELHGGRVWIESEEGRGTRVTVELPMKPCALAALA